MPEDTSRAANPLAEMLDCLETGVLRVEAGRITFANRAAVQVLGLTVKQASGAETFDPGERLATSGGSRPLAGWETASWESQRFEAVDLPAEDGPVRVFARRVGRALLLETTLIEAKGPVDATDLLRPVIDAVPGPVYIVDRQGVLRLVNRATAKGIGLPVHRVEGRDNRDLGLDLAVVQASLDRDFEVIDTGRPQVLPEQLFRGHDGRDRWFELYKLPIVMPDGSKCCLTTGFSASGRRRFRERMELRERMLRKIIDAIPSPLFVRDAEGTYRLANEAAARWLGTSVSELEGKRRTEIPLEDAGTSERLQSDLHVIETGGSVELPARPIAGAPGTEWFDIQKVAVDLPDGTRAALTTTHRESERARLARELEHREQLLRSVIDADPSAIYVRDAEGRFLLANQTLAASYGVSPDDLIGRVAADLGSANPAMSPLSEAEDRAVLSDGARIDRQPTRFEHGGQRVWLQANKLPLDLPSGERAVLGIVRDVTDREEARRAAEERERDFRALVDQLPIVIYREDLEGHVTDEYVSPRRGRGGPAGVDHHDRHSLIHPDDQERVRAEDERTNRTGEPFAAEYRSRDAAGNLTWIRNEASLVRDEAGAPLYWRGFTWDITDRKVAEERALQSEVFYRSLVEELPLVTYRYPARGSTAAQYVSPQWDLLMGIPSPADLRERYAYINPGDRDRVHAMDMETDASGAPFIVEYRVQPPGRPEIWVLDHAVLVRDERGDPWYWQGYLLDITERRSLEKRLESSEQFLRTVFETVPDTLFVKDSEERYLMVNAAARDTLGLNPAEMVGKTIAELGGLAPAAVDLNRFEDARVLQDGVSIVREPVAIEFNGITRWMAARKEALELPDGTRGILGVVTDVTAREEAAGALRQSEALHRSLVETLPFVTYRIPAEGSDVPRYISPQWTVLGLPPVEAIEAGDHVHPDDRPDVFAIDAHCVATGEPFTAEYRFVRGDGEIRWARDHAVLIRDEEGKPWFWQGVIEDVTDLREAKQRTLESEARYRTLAEHSPLGIRLLAADADGSPGDLQYVNPRFRQLFGAEAASIGGWRARIHPEDLPGYDEAFAATRSHEHFRHSFRVRGAGGEWRWVLSEAVAVVDESGQVLSWLGVTTDISEQRYAEERLAESELRYRRLVEHLPLVIYTQPVMPDGSAGHLDYVSPQYFELTGGDPGERVGFLDGVHPEDVEGLLAASDRTDGTGEPFEHSYRVRGRDGSWLWLNDRATLIAGPSGEPLFWQGFMLDVTAQKVAEEQLRESEERYRSLVEELPAMVYVDAADEAGSTIYVSPRVEAVFGYTVEEWQNPPDRFINDILHPGDRPRLLEEIARNNVGVRNVSEYRCLTKDGRLIWIYDESNPVTGPDGEVTATRGFMLDVTAKHEAEDALRASEEHFRSLVESLPLAVYRYRRDGTDRLRLEFVSAQMESHFGLTAFRAIDEWLNGIHPDDRDRVSAEWRRAEKDERTWRSEYRRVNATGDTIWLMDYASLTRDETGKLTNMEGFVQDITERKLADEMLSVFASQQAAIAELSRTALSQDVSSVEELAELAVEAIARTVGGERALIFTLEASSPRLLASRGWDYPPPGPFEGDSGDLCQTAFTVRTGVSVVSGDVPHDGRFIPVPEVLEAGMLSSVSVVIPGKSSPLGAIVVHSEHANAFTAGESRFLESIAGVLGAALERRFAEGALTTANDRMQTLIAAAPLAISAVDAQGTVTAWNPAAEAMYGIRASEVIGQPVPPELESEFRLGLPISRAGGSRMSIERRHQRRDGSEFDVTVSFAGLPGPDGGYDGMIALAEDITERKRAEAELRLRGRALAAASNAILVVDATEPGLPVRSMNPAVEQMTGFSEEDVIGEHPRVLIRGPRADAILGGLREARLGGRGARVSFENERKDGSRYWVELAMSPVLAEDGTVSHLVVVANDTTELVRRGEELQVAKQRLEGIIDASPLAIVSVDVDGLVDQWNTAAEHIFGWTAEEVLGTPPPFVGGSPSWESGDTLARRKDEREIDVRVSAAPLAGPGGEGLGYIGLFEDVTDLKQAEIERMRLIAAIDQAPASFTIADIDDHIVYVNPAFEEALGYTFAEILGKPMDTLAGDGESEEFWLGIWESQQAGLTWRGTVPTRRKDGSQYQAELIVAPIRGADGAVMNYLYVSRDVTREQTLEEQLRQTQKMEAIGRLAGGVAHDFNNLLTAITGFTHLLNSQLPDADPRRDYTAQVLNAAEQAASLTQQLLAFSRRDVVQSQLIDLNTVVRNSEKILGRLIGEDIRMRADLVDEVHFVHADRGQIEQIVMNLAVNARDAMPRGGDVTIQTAICRSVPGHDLPLPDGGGWYRLTVADTGVGMDEATRARIFEPFFTTKGHAGTGLGLATVYGIVQQSGGQILVDSTPGEGTRFHVYLPLAPNPVTTVTSGEAASGWASADRRESILLVEDEPGVREYIMTLVMEMGHDVLTAGSGEEALRVLAESGRAIDVLVTDVVMPGMSGRELAEQLREQTPGLAVMFMSGYTDDAIVRHGVSQDEVVFLQKPFQPASFGLKLREAIERAKGLPRQ